MDLRSRVILSAAKDLLFRSDPRTPPEVMTMLDFPTSLYEPLFHDIVRAGLGQKPDDLRWILMAATGAGMFTPLSYLMWRLREMSLRWALALAALSACMAAFELHRLGFEGAHLRNALVLLWIAPSIAAIFAFEVTRRTRATMTQTKTVVQEA
jgi:hypothetical protein